MFYTIVSRSFITKINTSRDYFYIFLIGSVCYVILHWYLHMDKRDGIIEKVREYMYYTMILDGITAYVLMILYPPKNNKKNTESVESDREQYSPEQKKAIMQKMQEARRLQQLRQRHLVEQENKLITVQQNLQDPEQSKDQQQVPLNKDSIKIVTIDSNKPSIFTKSEKTKESRKTESRKTESRKTESHKTESEKHDKKDNKKINKKEPEIIDTEIPMYVAQDQDQDKPDIDDNIQKIDKKCKVK